MGEGTAAVTGLARFRMGSVECALVDDGTIAISLDRLFPAARRSEWPALPLDEAGRYHCQVTCLLVWSSVGLVLVDTGNGLLPDRQHPGAGLLVSRLAAAGLRPEDVDVVLLTHGHGDHVGGLVTHEDGRPRPTFGRARHVMTRADWDFFTDPEVARRNPYVARTILPAAEAHGFDLVDTDAVIGEEIRLLPAPGHTPGQVAVEVSGGSRALLFLADVIHHTIEVEKPELVRDQDVARHQVPGTRRRIFDHAARQDARVTASHLPFAVPYRLRGSDGAYLAEGAAGW
jgi:glyoxylase-like metal-dependent hydrolase (beta-lactamase superfamily II)